MNLKEIHKHIANKWVKISGLSSDIKKSLADFEGNNLIGYVYIDHTHGITLEIVQLFDIKNDEIILKESPLDKGIRVISRLDAFLRSKEIQLLKEELIAKLDLEIPEYIKSYERNDLAEFRLNDDFHEFRADGYPDDVQILLLPNNAFSPELVFGRVEKYENDTLTFSLLNQPHQNIGININDSLSASLGIYDDAKLIICEVEVKTDKAKKKKPWWKF